MRPSPPRLFPCPRSRENRLVVVTEEDLWVSHPPPEDLERIQAALARGEDPARHLPGAEKIALDRIRVVSANLGDEWLTVRYASDEARERCLQFDHPEMRNQVLAQLEDRLPGPLQRSEEHQDALQAGLPWILWGLFAGLLSAGLALAARDLQSPIPRLRARPGFSTWLWESILRTMGPTGVAILGVLAVAVCARAAWEQVRTPPRIITLTVPTT